MHGNDAETNIQAGGAETMASEQQIPDGPVSALVAGGMVGPNADQIQATEGLGMNARISQRVDVNALDENG